MDGHELAEDVAAGRWSAVSSRRDTSGPGGSGQSRQTERSGSRRRCRSSRPRPPRHRRGSSARSARSRRRPRWARRRCPRRSRPTGGRWPADRCRRFGALPATGRSRPPACRRSGRRNGHGPAARAADPRSPRAAADRRARPGAGTWPGRRRAGTLAGRGPSRSRSRTVATWVSASIISTARHHGRPGKVALKELFVDRDVLVRHQARTGVVLHDSVEQVQRVALGRRSTSVGMWMAKVSRPTVGCKDGTRPGPAIQGSQTARRSRGTPEPASLGNPCDPCYCGLAVGAGAGAGAGAAAA